MPVSFKDEFVIDGLSMQAFIEKLDFTLNTTDDRKKLVEKLFAEPNFFERYNACFPHSDYDNERVSKALELIADYMMGYIPDFPCTNDMVKHKKFELSTDFTNDINAPLNDGVNFYKENKQKIYVKDFKDPELSAILLCYKKYKISLQKVREAAKRNKDGKLKYKCDKVIGDVNRDMLDVKNSIKKPIRFKHAVSCKAEIDWLRCDYTNYNHVKELLLMPKKRLLHDLGVLIYDLDCMLKQIDLNKSERKTINFIRNNSSLTQKEMADELKCDRSYINHVIKRISLKIVDFATKKINF